MSESAPVYAARRRSWYWAAPAMVLAAGASAWALYTAEAATAGRADVDCFYGDTGACLRYGRDLQWGASGKNDLKGALAAYTKACTLDRMEGCVEQADALTRWHTIKPDVTAAVALYGKGCKAKIPRACLLLGGLHEGSGLLAADLTAAAGFYLESCKLGDPEGCRLAIARATGEEHKTAAAVPYPANGGCEPGKAWNCVVWGVSPFGETPSPSAVVNPEGLRVLRAACEEEPNVGCLPLAQALVVRDATPARAAEARAALQRVCDAGLAEACGQLASGLADATWAADPKTEQGLRERACSTNAFACIELANRTAEGRFGTQEPGKSVALRKRACTLNASTCLGSAEALWETDPAAAVQLLESGCDKEGADHSSACGMLGVIYARGAPSPGLPPAIPPDAAKSLGFYVTACEIGTRGDFCAEALSALDARTDDPVARETAARVRDTVGKRALEACRYRDCQLLDVAVKEKLSNLTEQQIADARARVCAVDSNACAKR